MQAGGAREAAVAELMASEDHSSSLSHDDNSDSTWEEIGKDEFSRPASPVALTAADSAVFGGEAVCVLRAGS